MSAWVEVAQLTLTKNWQFTNAIEGRFFRVRHLQGRRVFSGWIAQADVSNPLIPMLSESRGLFCKEQPDLYEFPYPPAFGSRSVAVKRLDDSLSPWIVAIDVLSFDVGENPNVYQDFSSAATALMSLLEGQEFLRIVEAIAAHEAAANPHPEYLTGDALAIADLVSSAQLAAAIAGLVSSAQLAAAIADLVTSAQLSAALANKPGSIILTTTTTTNGMIEMATPQRVTLKPNSTAGYSIDLTAQTMNNSGNPEFMYWIGSGALTRGATAASTILQTQTATRRSSGGIGSSWNPDLTADTVNGGLKIRVPGAANRTVKWVAHVRLFEVF